MKATPQMQARLLELVELDTTLAQLAHRLRSLPELTDIARLEQAETALEEDVVRAQTELSDIRREVDRAEAAVQLVRDRAARNQQRLDAGTGSPKDLQGLQHELESLARRQGVLEDEELEAMERAEQAEAAEEKALAAREAHREQLAGLLEEKEHGTLTRLEAAPIPRWAIPLGKAMTSFLLALVSLTVLAVATTLLMGSDWGNPFALAVLFIAVSLAATSLVGIVAAFARTPEGAGNLVSIIAVAMGMVGGSFFPVTGGNRALELTSLATPHSWFLRGVGELHAGGGLASILPSIFALLVFTVVGGSIAAVFLGRRFR